MKTISSDMLDDLQNLESGDSSLIRETANKYYDLEMPEKIAEILTQKLLHPDNGVRDAVANSLINNSNPNIASYVVPYVASKEISTRNLAGEILLKRGVSSIPAMLDYLDQGNNDDKKFLVDVMGLIGDLSPMQPIINLLKVSKDENVILACLEALGNIQAAEGVDEIILAYDKSELFRPTAIEALGKIGSEEAVNFMIAKYPEEDELTKFSIIESFGQIGNPQAFFMMLSEMANLKDQLTWAAVYSLRMLKDKLGLDVPFDEHMKNAILRTLIEGEIKYKRAAADLITAFDDKDIVAACMRILGSDDEINENIKSKLLDNPQIFYPLAAELLKEKPKNSNLILNIMVEMIQADGGESLGSMSEMVLRNLCDSFAVCLEHTDEEVRRNSIELLFFINYEMALVFLDTMMNDDNYWNRLRIVEILESIEDEKTIEGLQKLASDSEEMVAERAAAALSAKGIN